MRIIPVVFACSLVFPGLAGCSDSSGGGDPGGETGAAVEDADPFGGDATGGSTGDEPGGGDEPGNGDGTGDDTPGPDATGGTGGGADVMNDVEEVELICDPGETRCSEEDPEAVEECASDGLAWYETVCPVEHGCLNGGCVEQVCLPGETTGECLSLYSYERCNDSGTQWEIAECVSPDQCLDGVCIDKLCSPGHTICKGFTQRQICDSDGLAWVDHEPCQDGGLCDPDTGKCISPCDANVKDGSYLGCDYWAVDLDNTGDAQHQIVGVVVSVPNGTAGTPVTITNNATKEVLGPADLNVQSTYVGEGQTKVFELPLGFDVDGSMLSERTFRIETESPVAVHQFNPLNGEDVFTNDASLLLPSNVTGQEYFVMSWPHRADGSKPLRGFATVIATQEGITNVTIKPTAEVVAGTGIAALQAGKQYLFVLEQGQSLNFETADHQGIDLTGTFVQANQKISVIGGHECANVPLGISACDHLEQQLFPVETWSIEYFADAFKPRSPTQVDIWRVMAGDNDVTVTTTPPVPGYEQFLLQRGQWIQFASGDSFLVSADGPIMVGHYLSGSSYPGAEIVCLDTGIGKDTAIGDPAFTLSPPVKKYLKEYAVLTPEGYAENYLNMVVKTGTDLYIDGIPYSGEVEPIPGTDYGVARAEVQPGVHAVSGSTKFGLTAYGYDCDVSYAYPGGLKLQGFSDQGDE